MRWFSLVRGRVAVAVVGVGLVAVPLLAQNRAWSLPGLDGGQLRDSDVAQRSTVVVIWAGWSPRCRDVVERVNDLVNDVGARARVVTVDFQEEDHEVRRFLAGKSLRAPVYLDSDGAFAKRHRVSTLPGLVVYHQGQITYRGRLPDDPTSVVDEALK